MATIRAYTTIEQSRKLAKILPLESADMGLYYSRNPQAARNQMWVGTKAENADIPCWSLAALLGVLPRKVELEDTAYTIGVSLDSINYSNVNNGNLLLEANVKDNLVDACYELILKLDELKKL